MVATATSVPGAATPAAVRFRPPAGDSRGFWLAQSGGWSAYFLLHYAGAALDNDFAPWWASFASAVAGFLATSAMAPLLGRVWRHGPAVQVAAALGLALVFSVPYSAVSEQAYWLGQGAGWRPNSLVDYLGSAFWCGSILLTWTGVYFGLNWFQEAHALKLRTAQAESRAREARLAVLRERLNPHFLFNALNGVSTLVIENENERASTMLEQLCALLRRSIDETSSPQVTLAEELELAELYLAIQQTRYEDRLRVEWRVAGGCRHLAVPSMILQPLLENAVRYGVQPDPAGATVVVSVQVTGDRLVLAVENTLRFATPSRGSGVGQRNIRERLAALYGADASFTAEPRSGSYRASIALPATAA